MAKLKVLFLTYCYPPQRFPRSVQISHLVAALQEQFAVSILTAPATANVDASLLQFTGMQNVETAHLGKLTKLVQNARGARIKKALLPDQHYLWHFDLYQAAVAKIKADEIDVVVTFGQPMSTHIVGHKLKKRFPRLQWLAHFSDPWIDNPFNEYNVWTRFWNQYYQTLTFKTADKLVFTSPETVELVMQSYPLVIQKKAVVLSHSFNQELYQPQGPAGNEFVIRYLGNFYGARQPWTVFAALQKISSELSNVRIELIGANTMDTKQAIAQYGLSHMVFALPAVNYLESLNLATQSDLLLVVDAPAKLSPFLPSKLIDYIGANKPIFAVTPPGTCNSLVASMGFNTADPTNVEDIASKLLLMIADIKSGKICGVPDTIRHKYTHINVAKEFATMLEEIRAAAC